MNNSKPPEIVLTLPSPPPINHYWRTVVVKGRPRTLLSKDARRFKEQVAHYCIANNIQPLDGPLAVHIDWYRPRKIGDIDAPLKSCLDAMIGFAYRDDKQIVELHVYRRDDKDSPRVEVAVQTIRATLA